MPISYRIYPRLGLVVLKYRGVVRVDDCADVLTRCADDPQFQGDMDVMGDLNYCSFPETGFRDMLRMVRRLGHWFDCRSPSGHSVLWARDDVNFGVGRMYQGTVDGHNPAQVGVFRTQDEALDFLGRSPEDTRAVSEALTRELSDVET